MARDVEIDYLANHPEHVPVLAGWFWGQWRPFYTDRTEADVEQSIRERLSVDRIPLALIALREGQPVGTVCLKHDDMDTRRDLGPWLAGMYVEQSHRGKGIGSRLVDSILREAGSLGIQHLYLFTPSAEGFFAKLNWSVLERTTYRGFGVTIMERKDFV
jgi:GNAT superfamily N-acetyltransferase